MQGRSGELPGEWAWQSQPPTPAASPKNYAFLQSPADCGVLECPSRSSFLRPEAETESQAQAAQAPAWRGSRSGAEHVFQPCRELCCYAALRGAASLSKTGRDLAWTARRSAMRRGAPSEEKLLLLRSGVASFAEADRSICCLRSLSGGYS